MTRLEQALRWWNCGHEGEIPVRHVAVLHRLGMLEPEQNEDGERDLTAKGKRALEAFIKKATGM